MKLYLKERKNIYKLLILIYETAIPILGLMTIPVLNFGLWFYIINRVIYRVQTHITYIYINSYKILKYIDIKSV